MGTGSSKKINDSEHLKDLLDISQKEIKKLSDEKEEVIKKTKEEIEQYLKSKDINISKEKMITILKAEDDIYVYHILNHILQTLIEKTKSLVENKECPAELKSPLNTIIYSAPKLDINELKEFRDIFKEKYGKGYINKVDIDEDNSVNEVVIEKLKKNNDFREEYIKVRLKLICQEKKIEFQFLENSININKSQASSELSNSSRIRKADSIHSSLQLSIFNRSSIHPDDIARSKKMRESQKKIEEENKVNNSDKYSDEFEELQKNDPLKRIKTIVDPNEELKVMQKGENLFLPYDEKIDEKCYNINNISNWAESFYNLKTGIILERYKELLSKSENSKFFEALNYEYGINNCPLDLQKAFEIYKNAADTTTDTLSMYRLYHIYKKDFKKFNIEKRIHVLEKFYIMKCFAYATPLEKNKLLFQRFKISDELQVILMDKNNIFYKWYLEYFDFLQENYRYYNIKKDDTILIEAVIYYYFEKLQESRTEIMDEKIFGLIEEGNPHAMYNLVSFYIDEKDYYKYYEELYNMNYYKCFSQYAQILPNDEKEKALTMLKKSITNGYISHIREYFKIFMLNYEIEDIIKSPTLKDELIFIIKYLIDNIILDDIDLLFDFVYMRNVLIKHYNFAEDFKNNTDTFLKEIINNLNKFLKGNNDENKKKIKSYFNLYYYSLIYTLYGNMCYLGIKGIMEKNYTETLNKYNYLLENDDGFLVDRFYIYYIYMIKNKQKKLNNKAEDKELIELEKKILNLFYADLSVEKIKKYPPSFFYYLSRLHRTNTIKTKDLILEYVFLNRACNAKLFELDNCDYRIFEEKYLMLKAKNKIKEKNKEENFKKIKEGKGAINIEGYGEDGMICPICLDNKKSIIALPCKHFFCNVCMNRLLVDGSCPICRTEIKITFDIDSKKETLIKSRVGSLYDSLAYLEEFMAV